MADDDDMDTLAGVAAGAEGMKRVAAKNEELKGKMLAMIGDLRKGWLGQIEDLRLMAEARWPELVPKSSNFYGALALIAYRMGLLGKTGKVVKMKLVRSHGRKTDELIRL